MNRLPESRVRRSCTRRAMIGLTTSAGVLVAACGAPQAATESAPSRAATTGAIEFWHWGVSYEGGFQKLADEFNDKHPGATVNRTMPAGYDDKIQVTIAADSGGPDTYMQRGPQHKQWSHGGLAIDLTSYLSRDKTTAASVAKMHKVFTDFYHHEGKLYGVPWDF